MGQGCHGVILPGSGICINEEHIPVNGEVKRLPGCTGQFSDHFYFITNTVDFGNRFRACPILVVL